MPCRICCYHVEPSFTQILWLGTTAEAPPATSTHVSWCSLGLASFLVAVLVKQHFCQRPEDAQTESVIGVQAVQSSKQAISFYKKLGFLDITLQTADCGFSLLPDKF